MLISLGVLFLLATALTRGEDFKHEVIWMAPFFSRSGYGSEALSFVLPLSKLVPGLRIQQHGDTFDPQIFDGFPQSIQQTLRHLTRPLEKSKTISICHSEPGAWHPSRWPTTRCPAKNSFFSVGRTMFETDRLPSGWEERCNQMDQIWVPTKFHEQIFINAGVTPSKLVVVPEPIDTDFFDPNLYSPMELEGKDFKFKFLSTFKWEDRKGWQILFNSFLRAFTRNQSVALYILTHDYHDGGDQQQSLEALTQEVISEGHEREDLPPIFIIKEYIPTYDLPKLYKACDAFVLPSRGEGWGRPHVEAMSMELPIIATFWSGPTEFMTTENSFPLNIKGLVPVGSGPFATHAWAEPDSKHLIELMQTIYRDPSQAALKGKRAREDMIAKYHPNVVAKIVFEHLAQIQAKIERTELSGKRLAGGLLSSCLSNSACCCLF